MANKPLICADGTYVLPAPKDKNFVPAHETIKGSGPKDDVKTGAPNLAKVKGR